MFVRTRLLRHFVIPLLQVHWPCEVGTPLADTFSMLQQLQQEGLIQNVGICNYPAKDIPTIQRYVNLASIQSAYSMIRREIEADIIPLAKRSNISLIGYEVLARGLLTGKYLSEPIFPSTDLRSHDPRFSGVRFDSYRPLVQNLRKISHKVDFPVCAVAIAWGLQRVDIALVGIKTPQQLVHNAKAIRLLNTPKIHQAIDTILSLLNIV